MPRTSATATRAPSALTEADRLRILRSFNILDTPTEAEFDDLARLAAVICGTPVAAVSLIDEARQWFKAAVGTGCRETSRSDAICDLAIRQREPLIISDTAADPRVAHRGSFHGEPATRFYAGVPLITREGAAIGALCVVDHVPRTLAPSQVDALATLARQVMDQFELRRQRTQLTTLLVERDRITDELRRTTEHLEVAQRIAAVGSWEHNLATDAIYWSDEVYRIFGFGDRGEFAPSLASFLEVVHPDDREPLMARQRTALATGVPLDATHRIVRPDGSVRVVRERGEVRVSAAGEQLLAGTVQDITDQHEFESRLRQSEERFVAVARATSDIIWDWDLINDAHRWDDSFALVFGSDDDPATVASWTSRIHPDDAEDVMAGIRAVIEGTDDWWSAEYRFRRRDGTYAWVFDRGSVIRDASGRAVRMVGGLSDRSERREAEEALRASERRLREAAGRLQASETQYRLLFDGNPHPMWVYEYPSLRFLAVNRAACDRYGYTREEFLAMTLRDLRNPEEVEGLLAAAREAATRGGTSFGVFRHRTRDGTPLDVELSSDAITFDGRPARLVLANDVTERRRLEAQLLRAQRMESLGTLAGGIAHDLNNVLAPILMSIDGLRESDTLGAERDVLDTIEASARRGAELVRQVLTFARGTPSRRDLVDVRALGAELARFVRDTFERNITLQVEIDPALRLVAGDQTQLHQLLLNLCVNARDAMPDGGTLLIGAANVAVGPDHRLAADLGEGRFVHLVVRDTGTGIPDAIRTKIFDPFFTTKETGRGTGLGLATVMGIVKGHGGWIEVETAAGEGSSFHVYLPAVDGTAVPQPEGGSALPGGQGETVLVVDDDEPVRTIMQRTLEKHGYRVVTAEHGVDALRVHDELGPGIDLVITDMMMPVLDGVGTIHALRERDPGIRIVAASGMAAPAMMDRVRDAGVTSFLAKPYTAASLLSIVREALEG